MAKGPNNQGIPDQDGLTPEVFAQVDWGKAVEADGKVNLQKIAGVSEEVKAKIIKVLGKTQFGWVAGAERELENRAKNSLECVSPMDGEAKARLYREIVMDLYGECFGIGTGVEIFSSELFSKIKWESALDPENMLGDLDISRVGGLTEEEKKSFLEAAVKMYGSLEIASSAFKNALNKEFYKFSVDKTGEKFKDVDGDPMDYGNIYKNNGGSEMEIFVRNVARKVFGKLFGVKKELDIDWETGMEPKELVLDERTGEWSPPPVAAKVNSVGESEVVQGGQKSKMVSGLDDQPEAVTPETAASSEATVPVEALNRYLKLQLRVKEGKPDLTKRDDLGIGINLLRELAVEEGADVVSVLNDKVMESKSPAALFAKEREVTGAEGDLSKLTDASKFFWDASSKKFNELVAKAGASKIKIDGNEVDIEDKSREISELRQQVDVGKSELSNPKLSSSVPEKPLLVDEHGREMKNSTGADASERKTVRSDVAENIKKLAVNEKIQKAFEEREKFVKELYEALTTLFEHLSVLVKNECFSGEVVKADMEGVNSRLGELNGMSRSLDFSKLREIVGFLVGSDKREGILSKGKKESVLKASDEKRGEFTDKLRTDKKVLEFSKQNSEGNTDLTDSAFALRIIKYKLLKDPENKKLSLEDFEKLAKRTLVEELWKFKTQKSLSEAIDGAPTDLLKIFEDVAMKEKVLKFNYKVGDAKKEPFKGLTPNDLKDEKSIENLFASGRVDLKKAFMLLGVIDKAGGGAGTAQYGFLRKKIFDLLGEEGLTPAQAIKAFNDQMEKIDAVASQYVESSKKSASTGKKIKELKVERAMEKYRRGELDYNQLQDELEDAEVFKDGKLTEGSVSRLGLYTGYLWNNRYAQKFRDRLTDVARDTGKFLGRNLILAPLHLGAKWSLKGGLSLAGSAIAKPFRLIGYPLGLLRAPGHVLWNPIRVFRKPKDVFKEAGEEVSKGWDAKAKATETRRSKRLEAAKAELGKWKEPFAKPKYEWKSSYIEDAKKNPSKDLGKLDARIDRLKKKAEEAEVVLAEEPFLDYSKYKTNTGANEQVKKAA